MIDQQGLASYLDNDFYRRHVQILLDSFYRYIGSALIDSSVTSSAYLHAIESYPFPILSHGTQCDPVFNYANPAALALFGYSWQQITQTPSRLSAETLERQEREQLLRQVSEQGYIDNYSGIRIASTGQRFCITNAYVWNLHDEKGEYYGQAATFDKWRFL